MDYNNYTKEQENKLIIDAFDDLQKAYSESNHKQKYKLVAKAFDFSRKAHEGAKRRSGEPYILHPLSVAKICVSEMGLGSTSICAALLHDVVEDTEYNVEDIKAMFGDVIANIVDGLTKISGEVFHNNLSKQAENFHRLILTIPSDIRVIMIKIADRLHNIRTLGAMSDIKQQIITGETLYIYAPIAERLGFFHIKTELENLCLKYQQPDVYNELTGRIEGLLPQLKAQYERFIKNIKIKLDEKNIKYRIIKRIKSPYSIYKKKVNKGLDFDEIYDLLAVRIIIDTQEGQDDIGLCWSVFGVVTSLYNEHPNRTRNWLTNPKSNGYQALHLTVMQEGEKDRGGNWIEVQIRTSRMDEIAERGLAAHWKYKNGIEEHSEFDEWFRSLKELLSIENIDTVEFVDRFKINLHSKEIFVFTPKGEMRKLPNNATVLDFAFSLHTELGMMCIGGKVDGKLVPVSEVLKNGNQVEILTAKTQQPDSSWLEIAKTQTAQQKIRSFLRPEVAELQKDGAEKISRAIVELKEKVNDENIDLVMRFFEYNKRSDFYFDVSRGKIDLSLVSKSIFAKPSRNIFSFFLGSSKKQRKLQINKKKIFEINKADIESNLIKLATCCKPIQGDAIIGYVENDNLVIIHRVDCEKAQMLKANFGNKILLVNWQKDSDMSYLVGLSIEGIDRKGLLNQIIKVISEDIQINIKNINFSTIDGVFYGSITLFAHGNEEVESLSEKLLRINSIKSVKRINNQI